MAFILTFLVFILIISFLIISHEFGHFIIAKKAGLIVEEFALGFPPRIFSKKIGETKYSLNLIPFGGYVKIFGEEADEKSSGNKRSFYLQSPSTKAKVLLGGILANVLVAVFIFYLVLGFTSFKSTTFPLFFDYNLVFGTQTKAPQIRGTLEDSPAEESNLKEQDLILAVNGEKISNSKALINYINIHKGKELRLNVKNINSEKIREVRVTPIEKNGIYIIGVSLIDVIQVSYQSFPEKFFSGFLHTANITHLSFYTLFRLAESSFTQRTIEPLKESTTGIVGIFAITHITITEGIIPLLSLIAFISVALAIVNIFPIPALDGGRLIFVGYEALFKKAVPPELEKRLNFIGFVFLIGLIILVTYHDILRYGEIIKNMF